MRINCHSHIFNLKSVLTSKTVKILIGRIRGGDLPKSVKKALEWLVKQIIDDLLILDDPAGTSQDVNAKFFLDALDHAAKTDKDIRDFIRDLPKVDKEGSWHNRLKVFADKVKYRRGGYIARLLPEDLEAYVEIARAKSIDEVTDRLLTGDDGMPDGAIAVALMMDIFDPGDAKKGHDPFPAQLADTSAQILRYPGRVLPFVAVNPQRPQHYDMMTKAIEEMGYVGVKLYPSLGHSLDVQAMDRVFEYCSDGHIPVTMHCSLGGYSAGENWRLCDPMCWWKYLDKHKNLVIDFAHCAHFNGVTAVYQKASDDYLCDFEDAADWTRSVTPFALQILRLMRTFPGRVYTDIACHTELWKGRKEPEKYKARIRWFCDQPVIDGGNTVADYILWGSDFWMMRSTCSEREYWNEFEKTLADIPGLFDRMAEQNARRFLGFDQPGSPLDGYVAFVKAKQAAGLLAGEPADWLQSRLDG